MRISMSIIKNEHGVFHVRKKVPKKLEAATAQALGAPKPRVAWLKQSLGTKDHKEAKRLAPPVLMKFDRILAQAEALLAEFPLRTSLDKREIDRIAEYFYAHELAADNEERVDGPFEEAFFQDVARQLEEAGQARDPFSDRASTEVRNVRAPDVQGGGDPGDRTARCKARPSQGRHLAFPIRD